MLRYGEALVREVEEELERRAAAIAPGVPWRALIEQLRGQHPLASGLVDAYAAEMERAKRFVVERGLARVPDGALEVVATPDFMAPLIPFAAYDPPGAFAEARTGTFYVTVPREGEPREHCVHELAATALHEGTPGTTSSTSGRRDSHRPCGASSVRRSPSRDGRSTARS